MTFRATMTFHPTLRHRQRNSEWGESLGQNINDSVATPLRSHRCGVGWSQSTPSGSSTWTTRGRLEPRTVPRCRDEQRRVTSIVGAVRDSQYSYSNIALLLSAPVDPVVLTVHVYELPYRLQSYHTQRHCLPFNMYHHRLPSTVHRLHGVTPLSLQFTLLQQILIHLLLITLHLLFHRILSRLDTGLCLFRRFFLGILGDFRFTRDNTLCTTTPPSVILPIHRTVNDSLEECEQVGRRAIHLSDPFVKSTQSINPPSPLTLPDPTSQCKSRLHMRLQFIFP